MATQNGFFRTALKSLAIIGLGYAAKRLLSEPDLRAKVKDRMKSAMATVRDRAASLRGGGTKEPTPESKTSSYDSSLPTTPKNGRDTRSPY